MPNFQLDTSELARLINPKNASTYLLPPDKHILFISDVHLGSFDQPTNQLLEQQLIAILQYCEEHGFTPVITGDLFDYWMEFSDWHPSLGSNILEAFRSYHQYHKPTLYLLGNHDNWTLGYFEQLGFDVEHEYRLLKHNEHLFFSFHGDGLKDPGFDLPRSLSNRILRSDTFTRIYRNIFTPESGLTLMKYNSKLHKWLESEEKNRKRSVLASWAEKVLDITDLNAIICGHNHNPRIASFNGGVYVNPGSFGLHKTLVTYTNQKFQLVKWNHEQREIVDW